MAGMIFDRGWQMILCCAVIGKMRTLRIILGEHVVED